MCAPSPLVDLAVDLPITPDQMEEADEALSAGISVPCDCIESPHEPDRYAGMDFVQFTNGWWRELSHDCSIGTPRLSEELSSWCRLAERCTDCKKRTREDFEAAEVLSNWLQESPIHSLDGKGVPYFDMS